MLRSVYSCIVFVLVTVVLFNLPVQADTIGLWTFDEFNIGESVPFGAAVLDVSGNQRHLRNGSDSPGAPEFTPAAVEGALQFGSTTALAFSGNVGDLLTFIPGFDFGGGMVASNADFDIGPVSGGCPTCIGESYTLEAIVQLPMVPFSNDLQREGGVMGKGGLPESDHWGMNAIGPRHLPFSPGGDPGPGPVNASAIESVISEWVPDTPQGFFRTGDKFLADGISEGWHHLAITRDRATDLSRLFLDGVQFFEHLRTEVATIPDSPLGNFVVGARDSDGTTPFRGAIDAVAISNEALDPSTFVFQPIGNFFNWGVNGSGDWEGNNNWVPLGGSPDSPDHVVTFGNVIDSRQTVFSNADITVNSVNFEEPDARFIVGGGGSLSLQQDTSESLPSINVTDGSHEFQLPVILLDDTTINVADGATLTFNNQLDLNGRTLTKTGLGALAINNNLATGGGTFFCVEGTCSGTGTISGDVDNLSGILSPGPISGSTINGLDSAAANGSAAEAVPEPNCLAMLLLGVAVLTKLRRRLI